MAPSAPFNRADVIYYPESEYLPPLISTRPSINYRAIKGEPEYAKQEIISVPPDPDNTRQTIVTPPKVKLDHDVPLPNIVAWSDTKVEVPMAATARSAADMKLPDLPTAVIAPAPQVNLESNRRALTPESGVIGPPPTVQMASTRGVGDIDIGHSDVVAPAPELPMAEQHRAVGGGGGSLLGAEPVVPPPPSLGSARGSRGGGELIALSARPAPAGPIHVPEGNRRGTFAAGPEGKPGSPGTPNVAVGQGNAGSGSGGNAPAGLYVGPGASTASIQGNSSRGGPGTSEGREMASAKPPRVTGTSQPPAREVSIEKASDEEKRVFAGKKFYGMSLNMPNLNSGGGSWVIHFAELKDDSPKGDLSAPVAVQKVDPAYPTELMRQNVSGNVTLSAVIHSDGTVDAVRVLNSADDRLNEYARSALSRWRFIPATKNGNPIDLQAVVIIPFRPIRWKNSF
ncbi:MAG TPA: energy transducer TonB [Terriglobales bacterium]|nr:energy transducer TonB [Terriglobales bacterium]